MSSGSDRRRKRKDKERRKRPRSRSRDRKDKKKDKKKKKETGSVTSQWGKFGIITETDLYNKDQEFRAWLLEEAKINPESISKDQTRKQFAKFVEEFNTATLPHEKYYDLPNYEARMSLLRSGETLPDTSGYDPAADLAAHRSSHKKSAREQESFLSKEHLQELRRVQNERVQIGKMKVLGLDVKQNMGVRMDGSQFDEEF